MRRVRGSRSGRERKGGARASGRETGTPGGGGGGGGGGQGARGREQ